MVFARIRHAGRPPTAEERLADLLELHAERPGITEATLGMATTADGRTGYEVLAAEVPQDAAAVLDLGCGNGPLLLAVAAARPGVTRLAGVDLCAPEIAIAKTRLPEDRSDLRCEPATAMSFEDMSMDAVVSHHAFYLFDPMEAAIAEAARVLRPGGLFALVTWSFTAERIELFARLMEAMNARTRRDAPSFAGWADRRHFQRDVLEEMLSQAGFVPPLEVLERTLEIAEPAPRIAGRLAGFFYSAILQGESTRAELLEEWTRLLAAGRLSFPFSLTRMRKRG